MRPLPWHRWVVKTAVVVGVCKDEGRSGSERGGGDCWAGGGGAGVANVIVSGSSGMLHVGAELSDPLARRLREMGFPKLVDSRDF